MRKISLLVLLGLCILPLTWSLPNPLRERWLLIVHDAGHVPLFAVLQALLLWLSLAIPTTRFPRALWVTCSVLCALGIGALIEFAQPFVGRTASWGDWVFDGLGVTITIVLWGGFSAKHHRWLWRLASLLVVLAILVYVLRPAVPWLRVKWINEHYFPILMDAEHSSSYRSVFGIKGGKHKYVPAPEAWPAPRSKVIAVYLPKGHHLPGFSIENPYANWSEYSALYFEAYSPAPKYIKFGINFYSIYGGLTQLAVKTVLIQPGYSTNVVNLENTPTFNPLAVKSVDWHAIDHESDITIYFDNISLINNTPEVNTQ